MRVCEVQMLVDGEDHISATCPDGLAKSVWQSEALVGAWGYQECPPQALHLPPPRLKEGGPSRAGLHLRINVTY